MICDLLKKYKADIKRKERFFCPICFHHRLNERNIQNHFGKCGDRIEGKKICNKKDIIILKPYRDSINRNFLKRMIKFVCLTHNEIVRIPYDKNYDYYIILKHSVFGSLPIGIAFIKLNKKYNRYALSAIAIFPKENKGQGLGKRFIESINSNYKDSGGILIENPNKITKHIGKKFNIEYYYTP